MNRTESSRTYLFSGLLSCGLCGSNMVIGLVRFLMLATDAPESHGHFADVLTGDPTRARQELQKHITKLVLPHKETPNGSVFEVSGDVALFVGGKDDVMVT